MLLWRRAGEYSWVAKIADMGMAAERLPTGWRQLHGQVPGTPVYWPPEVHDGLPYTFAGDMFALGHILWQLMAVTSGSVEVRWLRHCHGVDASMLNWTVCLCERAGKERHGEATGEADGSESSEPPYSSAVSAPPLAGCSYPFVIVARVTVLVT